MELRHLRSFAYVAETLSFSIAASRCFVTQSAISQHIKALEDELATVEEAIAAIELQLTEPEVYGDHEKVQQFNQQLLALQARQDELMQDWEDQTTALEELNE